MRDILFFSYFFPPLGGGGVQRGLKFVKYLPQWGYRPHVVTTRAHWYGAPDPSLVQDISADASVIRAAEAPLWWVRRKATSLADVTGRFRWLRHGAGWPDEMSGWIPGAVGAGLRVARRSQPQLIFSTSHPFSAHIAAWLVHRRTGIPWVADFRDEWARNAWTEVPSAMRSLDRYVEDRICSDASRLVAVAPRLQVGSDVVASRSRTVTVITNGVDLEDFNAIPPAVSSKRLVISHVGSLYGPLLDVARGFLQGLELAAARCTTASDIEFRLIGRSQQVINSRLVRVSRRDYVPHAAAIQEMRSASALLLCMTDDVYAMTVPAKLYEYVAARRPVVCMAPPAGPAADLVRATNAGVVIHPEDTEGVATAVTELYSRWRSGQLREPLPSADRALRLHTRAELTQQLAELFDSVVAGFN